MPSVKRSSVGDPIKAIFITNSTMLKRQQLACGTRFFSRPYDTLVIHGVDREQRISFWILKRINMEINIQSGPTKMTGPRRFNIQNIRYASILEPRVSLMIKKIFFGLDQHPNPER